MRSLWALLLCCLTGPCVSAATQRSAPDLIKARRYGDHRQASRASCDLTYSNHSAGVIKQGCGPGQYRERKGLYRGQCVPCDCNGLSHECDPNTGKCLNCQMNTAGDHCERCAEGYYGNAALRTCWMCSCPHSDQPQSFAFGCLWVGDQITCLCRPGYSGARCQRCAVGFYGDPLEFGGSCQPCECNEGTFCDPITGNCEAPEDPSTDQDCQECDVCVQTLMDDLEAMDSEFSGLKNQLESYSEKTAYLTKLRKLENAINTVKELVINYKTYVQVLKPKVKDQETDMDGVKKYLNTLQVKADLTSLDITQLFTHLDTSHKLVHNLLTDTEELLNRIEELLEQLEMVNSTVEAKRMSKEVQHMVASMRRQSCPTQRRLAEDELRDAQRLLDYIVQNLTGPVTHTVEQIGQALMFQISEFKDLKEALKKAEKTVNKTKLINDENEAVVSNILKHHKMFRKEQVEISADLDMNKGTLQSILKLQMMMQDLTNSYAGFAAVLDGANTAINKRLSVPLGDDVVRQAEEHARHLVNVVMEFQASLLNLINTSVGHKPVKAIRIYRDVIDAIEKAASAANEAKKYAERALADVEAQNLTAKTEDLKHYTKTLHDEATKAENDLQEATQKYSAIKERLDKGKDGKNDMNQRIQAAMEELNSINTVEIAAVVNQTKDAIQAANSTVNSIIQQLENMSEGLDTMTVSSGDSGVNVNELHQLLPLLPDTLTGVEDQSMLAPSRSNMSDLIVRIKDFIKESRDMANIIRGPMMFSGDSHIELRPPGNLEDLRAFTAFSLMLRRPTADPPQGDSRRRRQSMAGEDNSFVLYLGNKNSQSDYVGMVVRDGLLYCVYKLGGVFHEIETVRIIESGFNSTFMDKVDFRRVYQDAEVIYTQNYNSPKPLINPPMINEANTTVSLLDLDPNDVVLYVGGYPSDFIPPEELRYPNYKGCIELYTLNEHILGIYNFQRAVNIKNTDKCLRVERSEGKYFDGTGYGKINMTPKSRAVMFYIQSQQENTMLCFMGNEDSHFTVTIEGGYVLLREKHYNQTVTATSEGKVIPMAYSRQIKIIQSFAKPKVHITEYSVNVITNYSGYKQAFIGGVPSVIAKRYNISFPQLRGCLNRLEVDVAVQFVEEVGIIPGCPAVLLGQREASLEKQSSLTIMTPGVTESQSDFVVSLRFQSTQSSGDLLSTGNVNNTFELSLADGHVEVKYNDNVLKSKHAYNDGGWHYVTALRNSTGMELNIDNLDTGAQQIPPSTNMEHEMNIILGKETFEGCIQNFYMRRLQENYIPADLSSFIQTGVVSWDSCTPQLPPLSITQKSSFIQRGLIKKWSPRKDCNTSTRLLQAFHLSSTSQLQYMIPPEDLNFRPHFSLDVQTRSSTGMLLHIADKLGISRIALFMSKGRVNLSVGEGQLISYHKKINNGDWHNIKFSVEQHTFHLVVDGSRVPDGQLKKGAGVSLDLQAPVYVGAGHPRTLACTSTCATSDEGKHFPQKSVKGCIRDVKFYDVLIGEPAVNHGGAPCFNGVAVEGAYFAGDGSHAILEKSFTPGAEFDLIFEARPRNMTGLLFHCRGRHGHNLSIFLEKGKMVVQMNDGAGDYSTSVIPPPLPCGDTFHHVLVTKKKNVLNLKVGQDSRRAIGPFVHSHSQICDTLYVGGVPENKRKRVPVWSSYVGCLRNVRINQADVLFQSSAIVFGPVNVNECPVN